MVREYAKYMGIAIVLIGVLGVFLGDQSLMNLVNIDIVEDFVHLLTGGLMAYAGFASRDADTVRTTVGGIGILYLMVGLIGFFAPTLFGLLPHGYSLFDNFLHVALGVTGIAVAWIIGKQDRAVAPAVLG